MSILRSTAVERAFYKPLDLGGCYACKMYKTTENAAPLVLPQDIRLQLGETNYCSSSEHLTVDSVVEGYRLSREKVYQVYGLLTANDRLRYLIVDDENIPGFFPERLFQVVSHDVPDEWITRKYDGPDVAVSYVTYAALNTYQGILGLMNNRVSTIKKFIDLKEWLEKWNLLDCKS